MNEELAMTSIEILHSSFKQTLPPYTSHLLSHPLFPEDYLFQLPDNKSFATVHPRRLALLFHEQKQIFYVI